MRKNPSERKRMPGESGELDRDTQQGKQHREGPAKEGQKGTGSPDWKKEQQQHRQGEPMGQKPKEFDPNKQRQPGDGEKEDERGKRTA